MFGGDAMLCANDDDFKAALVTFMTSYRLTNVAMERLLADFRRWCVHEGIILNDSGSPSKSLINVTAVCVCVSKNLSHTIHNAMIKPCDHVHTVRNM